MKSLFPLQLLSRTGLSVGAGCMAAWVCLERFSKGCDSSGGGNELGAVIVFIQHVSLLQAVCINSF